MKKQMRAMLGLIALGAAVAWAATSAMAGCEYAELDATETTNRSEAASVQRVAGLTYYTAVPQPGTNGFGYYIRAVNKDYNACADGTEAKSCFVEYLDFRNSGMDPEEIAEFTSRFKEGHAIAGGWVKAANQEAVLPMFTLYIEEAWNGLAYQDFNSPVYMVWPPFGGVDDTPCFAPHCPHYTVQRLNDSEIVLIENVDLEASGCQPGVCADGYRQLEAGPILVSGEIVVEYDDGDDGIQLEMTLVAENFFTNASGEPAVPDTN